VSFNIARF